MRLSHANDSEGEGPQLSYTNMHMHLLFKVMAVVVGDIVIDMVVGGIVSGGGGLRMTYFSGYYHVIIT